MARLCSSACRAAAMSVSTLPVSQDLRMTDVEFSLCLRYLAGIAPAPPNAMGSRCAQGTFTWPHDHDLHHAMNCRPFLGTWTFLHNTVEKQWRQIGSHALVASTRIQSTARFVCAQRAHRAQRAQREDTPRRAHASPPGPAPPDLPLPNSLVADPTHAVASPAGLTPAAPLLPPAERVAAAPASEATPAADADAGRSPHAEGPALDAAPAGVLQGSGCRALPRKRMGKRRYS